MAFQRATPPALRWVALFLTGCAVLGLTLGFRDQIRRNPPAWYTGGTEKVVAGSGLVEAKEATAFDPEAPRPALQAEAEAAKPKAEEEAKADEALDTPLTPTLPTTGTATAAAPTTPRPKPALPPPPKLDPPSEDPVGDLLEGQTKAPEPPPVVPY